jgi:hypothetical protein
MRQFTSSGTLFLVCKQQTFLFSCAAPGFMTAKVIRNNDRPMPGRSWGEGLAGGIHRAAASLASNT